MNNNTLAHKRFAYFAPTLVGALILLGVVVFITFRPENVNSKPSASVATTEPRSEIVRPDSIPHDSPLAHATHDLLFNEIRTLNAWWGPEQFTTQVASRYLQAAKLIRALDEVDRQQLFRDIFNEFSRDPSRSGAMEDAMFVLTRILFDLPESLDSGEVRDFRVCIRPAGTNARKNWAWPLTFENDNIKCIGRNHGHTGETYAVFAEYKYLRERFGFRKLDNLNP